MDPADPARRILSATDCMVKGISGKENHIRAAGEPECRPTIRYFGHHFQDHDALMRLGRSVQASSASVAKSIAVMKPKR